MYPTMMVVLAPNLVLHVAEWARTTEDSAFLALYSEGTKPSSWCLDSEETSSVPVCRRCPRERNRPPGSSGIWLAVGLTYLKHTSISTVWLFKIRIPEE